MNSYCDCDDEALVGGVEECPALADVLKTTVFVPFSKRERILIGQYEHGPVEDVGRYRFVNSKESFIYRINCIKTEAGNTWWRVVGEYCPDDEKMADYDYTFLDGGGFFAERSAALWAIHLWLAYLHKRDLTPNPFILNSNGV